MNASKYLASAVAAVTVVGAIGFAYAQNTYDSSRSTSTQNQTTPPSSTPADPSMQTQRQSGTTDATANTSTTTRDLSSERMARADRN